jgi:diguanylate cyclase (GGDEF)-like protein
VELEPGLDQPHERRQQRVRSADAGPTGSAEAATGRYVVPRLRLGAGQVALLAVLVLLLAGLVGTLVSAQQDARRHTDAATRTEASTTNAQYTMRESIDYSLAVQQYLLGTEPRRSVQIARALLAQRLSIVDESGGTAADAAGPDFLAALRGLDALTATVPSGTVPDAQRAALTAQLTPAVDALDSAARHLVDDSTSAFRAQSRAYDVQLVQTREVELALLLASLIVAALLLFWVASDVRRNHLVASSALTAQAAELERTEARLDRMVALDRGHARVLELIARGADLSEIFAVTAEAVSEVSGGHPTRVRWNGLEIVRPRGSGASADAVVGWSSTFGAGRDDDGPGEVAILADPAVLDAAATTGAGRCRDLARLAVVTDRAAQRLSFQARHDALTGLANRDVLLGELDEQLQLAARTGVELAVLFCDLDGFRGVNDSFGHGAGDALLIEAAARLRAEVRDVDVVARHGGDELVVLCPLLTDPDEAVLLAERIRRALSAVYSLDGRDAFVAVSIGVCYADDPSIGGHELLRGADHAMRRAKTLGGDRIAVFDWKAEPFSVMPVGVGADLARAIDRGELTVLLQPVVRLDDDRLTGFEALVRWHRPAGDVWLPERLLPLAEREGVMADVDRWVLRQALSTLAGWRRSGLAIDIPVSVNVSEIGLLAQGFTDEVLFLLHELGLPGSALVLELREEVLVAAGEDSVALNGLRVRGVRVCLDDFGTGHSSVTTLRSLPVDQIKLDRSFAAAHDSADPRQAAMVESVLRLAAGLSTDVVVEGVETITELATMRRLGVGLGQGWLLGRPMTVEDAERWMRAGTTPPAAAGHYATATASVASR